VGLWGGAGGLSNRSTTKHNRKRDRQDATDYENPVRARASVRRSRHPSGKATWAQKRHGWTMLRGETRGVPSPLVNHYSTGSRPEFSSPSSTMCRSVQHDQSQPTSTCGCRNVTRTCGCRKPHPRSSLGPFFATGETVDTKCSYRLIALGRRFLVRRCADLGSSLAHP
jgi:hypothetical protein